MRGRYVESSCYFTVGDQLQNGDGCFVGNTDIKYKECDGSGFIYDKDACYGSSKYSEYNQERHILGGNDFANMFIQNELYN
jgi:hypothetical protein